MGTYLYMEGLFKSSAPHEVVTCNPAPPLHQHQYPLLHLCCQGCNNIVNIVNMVNIINIVVTCNPAPPLHQHHRHKRAELIKIGQRFDNCDESSPTLSILSTLSTLSRLLSTLSKRATQHQLCISIVTKGQRWLWWCCTLLHHCGQGYV